MKDNDIKLPERPEPDGFITDGPFDKPVVINVYRDSTLEAYAREAVRMNTSQAENVDQVQALREALKELITWVPSADTYRRLGFDPEAAMRALGEARAALAAQQQEKQQ